MLHLNEYRNACVLAITETWLSNKDSDADLVIDGFGTPLRTDRDNDVTGNPKEAASTCGAASGSNIHAQLVEAKFESKT